MLNESIKQEEIMNRLYYFSGTGNTLYLAQRLADEIGNCELVSITSAMKKERINDAAERVGIIFPVYCFGTPIIIKEFLKKIQVQPDTYLFGCSSYGGLLAGAMHIFQKEAIAAGHLLRAGFAVQMPGNAIMAYDRIADEKQQKMFDTFEKRIPEIAGKIKEKAPHKMEQFPFPFNKMLSALHGPFMKSLPQSAKQFHTTDKCKLCGQCVNICPVGNIDIVDKKVTWGEKCEQCMACIQWCANEAIQFGGKTESRSRYHHSCVSREDIMVQGG